VQSKALHGDEVWRECRVWHACFVNNYFAINVEAHNLIYKNNAAGRDVNGNGDVNSFDLQWTYNWMWD